MECLAGLPHSIRSELSMSKIARLYIACWQHDSIWEECLKSVVPMINYTIITVRLKYTSTQSYDVDTAIANFIDCRIYSYDVNREIARDDALALPREAMNTFVDALKTSSVDVLKSMVIDSAKADQDVGDADDVGDVGDVGDVNINHDVDASDDDKRKIEVDDSESELYAQEGKCI